MGCHRSVKIVNESSEHEGKIKFKNGLIIIKIMSKKNEKNILKLMHKKKENITKRTKSILNKKKEYETNNIEIVQKQRRKNKHNLKTRYRKYITGAKERNLPFELTLEEFDRITKKPCFYCGELPKDEFGNEFVGIDRIDSNGNKLYGFGGYGGISGYFNNEDDYENSDTAWDNAYDNFVDGLMKLVAEDDTVLIFEVGAEKLRYVVGSVTVITSRGYLYKDIESVGIEIAKQMLDNYDYTTQCSY